MAIKTEVNSHLLLYPEERILLKPFLSEFDVTWARRIPSHKTEVSAYFLKPSGDAEEAFGFDQELLLVYSPFPKLEPRVIKAAEDILNGAAAKGRVERLTYIVVSEMPEAVHWIEDYVSRNQESRLIAAFCAQDLRTNARDTWYVRNHLCKQLFTRDLFDFRLPLKTDDYFFGREAEVLTYRDAIRRGENRGLFGLRKTGKTSLLFKVKRAVEAENAGRLHYIDCKSPEIRTLRWTELLLYLSQQIGTLEASADIANSSPAKISASFGKAVEQATAKQRVVLVFDEIEYISPLAQLDTHWKEDFTPFWQTIWSCQSRLHGLSAILAGVNPKVTEESLFGGVQNPLFGIVSAQYLKGLTLPETRRMVQALGRRMGLKFKQEAMDYLHSRFGGHPLLTRIACSLLNASLSRHGAKKPVNIARETFAAEEAIQDSDLSFYCEHVISELRQFYRDEYQMLEYLACKQMADFLEMARDSSLTKHLREYGLIADRDGVPFIAIPVVERHVGNRAAGSYIIEEANRPKWVAQRIESLIHDLRALERRIAAEKKDLLFGPNSFPEADRLSALVAVCGQKDFEHFVNVLNRCFVESIERFGAHEDRKNYFWDIKTSYPSLHHALERIKVYRHNAMHLALRPDVEDKLASFLAEDLGGRKVGDTKDLWFVLQQRILDGLFAAIQIEATKFG